MGSILLEGMEFFAFHGCFKEEQVIGGKFVVNLELCNGVSRAEETDRLQDTIDYVKVYRLVKKEMEIKSHLLEHVARRILDAVENTFPEVTEIRLSISKLNPPVGGKVQRISYKTHRTH